MWGYGMGMSEGGAVSNCSYDRPPTCGLGQAWFNERARGWARLCQSIEPCLSVALSARSVCSEQLVGRKAESVDEVALAKGWERGRRERKSQEKRGAGGLFGSAPVAPECQMWRRRRARGLPVS